MAVTNQRIFGLAVPLSLADIPDTDQALLNLNLDIRDLEVIRGAKAAGFDANDLQTISNLNQPIWKTFDRYYRDVTTYNGSLSNSAGADIRSRGNVEVFGSISASAFRYTLLDTYASTPVLRWGDISTSRVSSWSSLGSSISYGSDVKIGGKLMVGKLRTRSIPTTKTFASEIPTHKIKLRLNGTDQYFYVMKGIPIQFRGYFRDFDCTIDFAAQSVRNSWRVYNTNGTNIQDFPDVGSFTSSTLQYRSTFAAEKYIEIYTNPAIISRLILNNCSIQKIPSSRLTNLTTFEFTSNGLVDFPDLNFFCPQVTTLRIDGNPFYNGADEKARYFGKTTSRRIPATITTLSIQGCFKGAYEQNIMNRFPNLTSLTAPAATGNIYFYPDSRNTSGELPNFYGTSDTATQKITTINLQGNDFRTINAGVQGGIEFVSISNGGSNYAAGGSAEYTNVTLTNVSGSGSGTATANITVDAGVVVAVEIVNPGTGYVVGNTLSAASGSLGGGSGFLISVTGIINVLSVKQQSNITTLNLSYNYNLFDNNFSLSSGNTIVSVNTLWTRLSIANCANFSQLQSYSNYAGSNRKTLYGTWDGVFGSAGYPRTDSSQFKFENCTKLTSHDNNYSDVGGYLPKYVNCPELTTYSFYSCDNIVAGRPGKRKIVRLYQPGAIKRLGSAPTPAGGRPYRANTTTRAADTLANAVGATEAALVDVTTDSSGNVSGVTLVSAGAGYTTSMKVTISAATLGSSSKPNLVIDIAEIEQAFISSGNYTDGTYVVQDATGNSFAGINAVVQVRISGGQVASYGLQAAGQDYIKGDYITIPTSTIGGTSNLLIKVEEAELPKILYNDQFNDNPKISYVDIAISNVNFKGEVEAQAFTPLKNSLSFLRLLAGGRIVGGFPSLDEQIVLDRVYSHDQGWTGSIPLFSSAGSLREIYLYNNKFSGELNYTNKPSLYYINYQNNLITGVNNQTRLPGLIYFYMSNNQITGTLPKFSDICRNVEYLSFNNNLLDTYSSGLVDLPKLKSLDLSANKIPTESIDALVKDLVKNYNAAPRSGVLVNLQGSQMGAPTPYPVTTGIITTLSIVDQPSISNGSFTDIGSATVSNVFPKTGKYSVTLNNVTGDGSGASATIDVVCNSKLNVPTAINTTPTFTGTVGIINSIGTITNGNTNTLSSASAVEVFDTGAQAQNSGQTGFNAASVRVTITAGATSPSSVTLNNIGSGYSLQGTPDKLVIPLSSFGGNGNLVININSVNEFTNGTFTGASAKVDDETGKASATGDPAKVNVTVARGGLSITSSLVNPSTVGATGENYTLSDTIKFAMAGSMPNSGTLTYSITSIASEYFLSASYAVSLINNGGSGYTNVSPNNQLVTSNTITFRKPDGTNQSGSLYLNVGAVTSQQNRSVFTGFAAVEFLRNKGWSVQVQS